MSKFNIGGWIPQEPDERDYSIDTPEVQHFFAPLPIEVPPRIDLRNEHMPPIVNQENLGSCTANAAVAILDYCDHKAHGEFLTPSRLYQYYNTRLLENTIDEDSGASIRDSIKAIAKFGAIPESKLPYDVTKFRKAPTKTLYKLGAKYKEINYVLVDQPRMSREAVLLDIKRQLTLGYPLTFGTLVFNQISYVTSSKGVIEFPKESEEAIGGHAMVMVGYDDNFNTGDGERGALLIRNSWGIGWGVQGYGWLPYKYVTTTRTGLSDIWCIVSENWRHPL